MYVLFHMIYSTIYIVCMCLAWNSYIVFHRATVGQVTIHRNLHGSYMRGVFRAIIRNGPLARQPAPQLATHPRPYPQPSRSSARISIKNHDDARRETAKMIVNKTATCGFIAICSDMRSGSSRRGGCFHIFFKADLIYNHIWRKEIWYFVQPDAGLQRELVGLCRGLISCTDMSMLKGEICCVYNPHTFAWHDLNHLRAELDDSERLTLHLTLRLLNDRF